MCFPFANLITIIFWKDSRNNGISAQEQLFDKLIKKALANVDKNRQDVHKMKFSISLERRSGFLKQYPVGLKKTEHPLQN